MAIADSAIEYAEVRAVLDHSLASVWTQIVRFGGLEHWADGVTACAVDGEGVGAVRTVTRNGATVRERLERCDPQQHEIVYRILEPHPLPADDVTGTITLAAIAPEKTEILWRSQASRLGVPAHALGERIEQFYHASILGLDRLLSAER